ncbi:MAG: DUF883 family protein [Gammaproteobacteria bacterium]
MAKKNSSEKLFRDLQTVVDDVEALLQATAAQTGERVDGIRARARESLQKAKARLVEAEEEALGHVREAATSADEYVHGKPWQAVGIAAGVGLLLGLLMGRR